MMLLSDLFEIRNGNSLALNKLERVEMKDGGIPFISRIMRNNGISAYVAFVDGEETNAAGELSCALSGNGVLSTFLQERPFYTGYHVACLKPKINLNKQQLLFYCACITANRYRFSFGRQANKTLKNLQLPNVEKIPTYVKQFNITPFDGAGSPLLTKATPSLCTDTWKYFELQHLFEIKGSSEEFVGETECFLVLAA